MKKFALIDFDQNKNSNVVWQIFEAEKKPEFHKDILIIDITDLNPQPQEGWIFKDDKFSPYIMPHEEVMKLVRRSRDQLLNLSDWTQVQDVKLSSEKIQEWKEYRQKLRDLTKEISKGTQYADVTFPDKPQ